MATLSTSSTRFGEGFVLPDTVFTLMLNIVTSRLSRTCFGILALTHPVTLCVPPLSRGEFKQDPGIALRPRRAGQACPGSQNN